MDEAGVARICPIDPKAANNVSVALATTSEANVITAQSSAVSGTSMRRMPAATPTMAASSGGTTTSATDHLRSSVSRRENREGSPLSRFGTRLRGGVAECAVERGVDDGGPQEAGHHGKQRHVEGTEPSAVFARSGRKLTGLSRMGSRNWAAANAVPRAAAVLCDTSCFPTWAEVSPKAAVRTPAAG